MLLWYTHFKESLQGTYKYENIFEVYLHNELLLQFLAILLKRQDALTYSASTLYSAP